MAKKNNKEVSVRHLEALDPGKIYVIQIDNDLSSEEILSATAWAKRLRSLYKIDIIFMPHGSLKFIDAPKGYKIVKDESSLEEEEEKEKKGE